MLDGDDLVDERRVAKARFGSEDSETVDGFVDVDVEGSVSIFQEGFSEREVGGHGGSLGTGRLNVKGLDVWADRPHGTGMNNATSTRHVGNCQVCEKDQKVQDGRMVHHGYVRPGDGRIHGDCPGVAQLPYEVSCDLVKVMRFSAQDELAHTEARLADLEAGRVPVLTEWVKRWVRTDTGHEDRLVENVYVAGVTERREFRYQTDRQIDRARQAIRHLTRHVTHLDARIAAWQARPVRTVEEEVRKAEAVKAERQAVLEARRAERKAKEDAKAARKADMMKRRFTEVAILATRVDHGQGVEVVHDIHNKARYSWLLRDYDGTYQGRLFELCGPQLRALGLIYTAPHNGKTYFKY